MMKKLFHFIFLFADKMVYIIDCFFINQKLIFFSNLFETSNAEKKSFIYFSWLSPGIKKIVLLAGNEHV